MHHQSLASLLLLIIALINWIVAGLVLISGYKKIVNVSYAVAAIFIGGWVFGVSAFIYTNSETLAFFWAKFYYLCPITLALFLSWYAKAFPNRSISNDISLYLITSAYFVVSVPLVLVRGFVTTSIRYHDWGKEVVLDKRGYLIYTLFFIPVILYVLIVMYAKSTKLKGLYKAQATFFFYGALLSTIFGTYFNLILPWFGNYRLIWAGPLFISIFLATIGYSILRHRMFDVRLLVTRFFAYLLTLGSLTLIYVGLSYFLIEKLVANSNGNTTKTVSIIFLLLATVSFSPLKIFFRKVTNKIFYRDIYEPQLLLDSINKSLVSNFNTEGIVKDVSQVIDDFIKSSYAHVEIFNHPNLHKKTLLGKQGVNKIFNLSADEKASYFVTEQIEDRASPLFEELLNHNIAYISKLVDHDELVGCLIVGEKRNGSLLSKQDVRLLNIISNELTIAIQNSRRFEEIQNFNETLQDKIDEATKELRKSNQKLKELDEAKDEFISMASHQLRTPLTSVKGYVSMVLEGDAGKITPVQQQLLEQAFTSSQRMVYLIADLLNVSRLRTGKFVIEAKPTYLPTVVEGEVNQLQETAHGRQLQLNFVKPEKFPTLLLDETKIRQVIMNFIDNAIYYTPPGGHIIVKLEEFPNSVQYTVTDDGIGVPKHEQHHLFTKFYRAVNARKARPDGTGLGLFMAKKVIIAQGGAIVFNSVEGKGSTFGFTFPKAKLVTDEPAVSEL